MTLYEFKLTGFEVTITKKDKKASGRVESAFLNENTEAYDIQFQTREAFLDQLRAKITSTSIENVKQDVMPYLDSRRHRQNAHSKFVVMRA